jgi:hypothetical protein
MFLADPTEKMFFREKDFEGRPRLGLSGTQLYLVAEQRLPALQDADYDYWELEWDPDTAALQLPGKAHYVVLHPEDPGVKYLQTIQGDLRLWLCAGQGYAAAFAVTRRKEREDV